MNKTSVTEFAKRLSDDRSLRPMRDDWDKLRRFVERWAENGGHAFCAIELDQATDIVQARLRRHL